MRSWMRTLLVILTVITILALVLSACELIDNGKGRSDKEKGKDKEKDKDNDHDQTPEKVTICHQTGSAKNPYVEITVPNNDSKDGHASHPGDLIPAPEGGCPSP